MLMRHKKASSIAILLIFLVVNSHSQDYSVVNPSYISYYSSSQYSDGYHPVRISCIQEISDFKEYLLAKEVNELLFDYCGPNNEESCCSPISPNWMGLKVIVLDNGTDLIICHENDTVSIITSAQIDQKWELFRFSNGNFIEAILTSIDSITFNGISDSVKIIEVSLHNSEGVVVESYINNFQLILSKSHGFLNALNFRDIPNFPDISVFNLRLEFFDENRINRLTTGEVYDYQVGDEFHERDIYDGEYPYPYPKHIYKVLDKKISTDQDTISYKIEHRSWGFSNSEYYFKIDTLINKYYDLDNNVIFSSLDTTYQFVDFLFPKEPIYTTDSSKIISYSINRDYNERQVVHLENKPYIRKEYGRNCYSGVYIEADYQVTEFIEGCGVYQQAYLQSIGTVNCYPCQEMVYYKKGEEVWGTPLDDPEYTTLHSAPDLIKVYPNPNNGTFSINTDLQYFNLMIIDALGRIIYKQDYDNKNLISISLINTNPGIYIIMLNSSLVSVSKILIIQ